MSRPPKTLREALQLELERLVNGYRVPAVSRNNILDLLAAFPEDSASGRDDPPSATSLRLTHDVYKPYDVVKNWHSENHTGRLEGCQEQPCHAVAKLGDK